MLARGSALTKKTDECDQGLVTAFGIKAKSFQNQAVNLSMFFHESSNMNGIDESLCS